MTSRFAEVIPQEPESTAPFEAWKRYLTQRLDNVDGRYDRLTQEAEKRFRDLGERIYSYEHATAAEIRKIDQRLQTTIGGADGRGLDRTWRGLATSLVGVALQLVSTTI